MTREERKKAINALKVSVPMYATTQEEFINYRQTLNKVMDWLEQEPILDKIRAEIEELDYITFDSITKRRCLEIVDEYRAESEV